MTPTPSGLSAAQRRDYDAAGIVRLPGVIPRPAAAAMADQLWRKMRSKYGLERDNRETWTLERPAHLAGPSYDAMDTPAFRAVVDDLLGAGAWAPPPRWGVALVCFPHPDGQWDVPRTSWHLDAPATAADPPIVRTFAILEPLEPGGGGTICLAGSHRVMKRLAARHGRDLPSAQAKGLLRKREPLLAELMSPDGGADRVRRFMREGGVMDGVPVKVVEMTGQPGDVILMHPLMLHSLSSNVRDRPRLVLTQWIYGRQPPA